jgi:hypothetical protein
MARRAVPAGITPLDDLPQNDVPPASHSRRTGRKLQVFEKVSKNFLRAFFGRVPLTDCPVCAV